MQVKPGNRHRSATEAPHERHIPESTEGRPRVLSGRVGGVWGAQASNHESPAKPQA